MSPWLSFWAPQIHFPWSTELLIELAEHAGITSPTATTALERPKGIRAQIERIKSAEYAARGAGLR